jgi:hydrogenase maturation factor
VNLVTGKIVEIYVEGGTTMARVQVGGPFTHVPIVFLPEAKLADIVVIDSGVAISRIGLEEVEEN